MKHHLFPLCLAGVLALTALSAQESAQIENTLHEAIQVRAELARGINDDLASANSALARLRAAPNPSGLPVETDADLGLAATDVAHRLLAAGRPTAAEVFFKAAESHLQQAVDHTTRDRPGEKAQYLEVLARIQGNYLAKPDQAKANIEAAIKLRPDDSRLKYLQQSLATLRSDNAPAIKQAAGPGQ